MLTIPTFLLFFKTSVKKTDPLFSLLVKAVESVRALNLNLSIYWPMNANLPNLKSQTVIFSFTRFVLCPFSELEAFFGLFVKMSQEIKYYLYLLTNCL